MNVRHYLKCNDIIQMNIFELILSDPMGYQTNAIELNTSQKNWILFKHNASTILQFGRIHQLDSFIIRSRQLWHIITKTSPELLPIMIEYYMSALDNLVNVGLACRINEIVNRHFKRPMQTEINMMVEAVSEVYLPQDKYIAIFDQDSRHIKKLRLTVRNLLERFELKQKIFKILQQAFRKSCLNIFKQDIIEFETQVKDYLMQKCGGSSLFTLNYHQIRHAFDCLHDFHLIEQYFERIYNMLNTQSQEFITSCTDFASNSDFMGRCLNYQRTFQKSFLKHLKSHKTETFFTLYMNLLDDNMYYLCAKLCTKNILDIILDFPDSISTILSLKKCLDRTNLLNQIGEYLIRDVEKRLLIPGVITQNILNQYINMLKVLQLIDPQGIIFEKITVPIKNYLLRRNDTLRCIISHLTDDVENYSKLTREVVKIPSKEYIEEMSSEEDENAAKEWQILPARQNKANIRVKYQQIDLVTVLVGLYGSQEAFICEYQNMMAEKLMSAKDYNIEQQIRNIELLKMRFGESALQTCNIIVKDVKDSKRNDNAIHKENPILKEGTAISIKELNCLAVSKGYWPINYQVSSTLQIPVDFKGVFDEYARCFSKIKAMRKIAFHYNLGHANLTLTFENGPFEFKCLPVQAIMITYFDDSKVKEPSLGVSSEQLSNELHIPQNMVKQKMSFWIHKGVVKEIRMPKVNISLRRMNSFEDNEVIYYKPVTIYQNIARDQIDDDVDSSILKESTSMESHLRHIIEGLIISILNINGPKSSEKIHLLLKTVYKTDLDYTYGQAQTIEILKKMHQRKKINFNGQVYSSKEE